MILPSSLAPIVRFRKKFFKFGSPIDIQKSAIASCEDVGGRGRPVRHPVVPLPVSGGVQFVRHPPLHGAVVPHVLQDHDLHQQRHQSHSLQRHVDQVQEGVQEIAVLR
ncbi:hypothetical protein CEXT_794321 [Caerostris extrusa]|uniref:Uncharacterized protein n=1 Tax=Caerostris extrusa TaxID=172846 RepID=A0AAV4Y516_CAEEX|nr:hypothetical protein CEXT_794321 [Caerostris extrusa]